MAPAPQSTPPLQRLRTLLARLCVAPIGKNFTEAETNRVRMFATIFSFYLIFAALLMVSLTLRPSPVPYNPMIGWTMLTLLSVGYVIARTHWYRTGIWMIIATIWVGMLTALNVSTNDYHFISLFTYLSLVPAAASLFLGPIETAIAAGGVLVTGFLTLRFHLPPDLASIGARLGTFLFITSGLAVIARYQFTWLHVRKMRLAEELRGKELRLELSQSLETIGKLSAIGEMATTVVEEIKAPLHVLVSSAVNLQNYLEAMDLSFNDGKDMEKLRTSADRIARTVSNLQTMALRALGEPLQIHSLTQIVRNALEMMKDKAVRQSVAFWFDETQERPLECFEAELLQAVINLVSNGIDAAAAQEDKWVEVRIEETPEAYQVVVTDSGPGIPDSVRQRLLEPFFTTKPAGKGTGLGLPLTRWAVERQGGSLQAPTDTPHTTFILHLPRRGHPHAETLTPVKIAS